MLKQHKCESLRCRLVTTAWDIGIPSDGGDRMEESLVYAIKLRLWFHAI